MKLMFVYSMYPVVNACCFYPVFAQCFLGDDLLCFFILNFFLVDFCFVFVHSMYRCARSEPYLHIKVNLLTGHIVVQCMCRLHIGCMFL